MSEFKCWIPALETEESASFVESDGPSEAAEECVEASFYEGWLTDCEWPVVVMVDGESFSVEHSTETVDVFEGYLSE